MTKKVKAKVVFATLTIDGKKYKPGEVVEVPSEWLAKSDYLVVPDKPVKVATKKEETPKDAE